MEKYMEAANLIKNAQDIIILTGAGMSTESGVKDFRSKDGLSHNKYRGYYPETILSKRFFYKNPDIFYNYLNEHLSIEEVEPNRGHNILVELEKNKKITIITQNIDSLHQRAGSTDVIELHGSIEEVSCTKCFKEKKLNKIFSEGPNCDCGGVFKPGVVLYEEDVPDIGEAFMRAKEADLLIVIGTSLNVYPAASIPREFGVGEKPAIIINRDKTNLSGIKNIIEFNEGIGATLKRIKGFI